MNVYSSTWWKSLHFTNFPTRGLNLEVTYPNTSVRKINFKRVVYKPLELFYPNEEILLREQTTFVKENKIKSLPNWVIKLHRILGNLQKKPTDLQKCTSNLLAAGYTIRLTTGSSHPGYGNRKAKLGPRVKQNPDSISSSRSRRQKISTRDPSPADI